MGRVTWPALAAALMLFPLAPAASAGTIRHASPDGVSTGNCTDIEPACSLKRAVETVAVAGDEVILEPGLYNPPSAVSINKAIHVHGQGGQPAPRVLRPTGLVFVVGGGGTLAYVRAESPDRVIDTSSVVERVTVLAAAGTVAKAAAVTMSNGSVLRDSLVRTESPQGRAVYASYGVVHLVNVTAIATASDSSALYTDPSVGGVCVPDSRIELHAANVIARGGLYDVDVPHLCGGSTSGGPPIEAAVMTHSNFRLAKLHQSPPDSRVEDEGGNQDVEPLFASPAALDFHQVAGSPTIDAGVATPLLGTGDFDGNARTLGAAPDIGADEYVPPPPPPPPADMDRPVASLLTVTPARFRAAGARGAARRRGGTRISYALDEAATVKFTVKRIVRRVVRHKRRTSYVPVRGSLTHAGKVGGNSLRFSGRLRGKPLKPGRYRLVALPADAAGNTGNAVLTRFRVVR
jgi:hypothetical protein